MEKSVIHPVAAAGLTCGLLVSACSPSGDEAGATAPSQAASAAPAEEAPLEIVAPAGSYGVDPNHASLVIVVKHLGLSNYVLRFNEFDATLQLATDPVSDSSIRVTIDPTSVDPDYSGDYTAAHPDSPFESWQEDLAQSDKFFNASEFPEISYESTGVSVEGDSLTIEGELTLRGQTRPVTLEAQVTGQTESHPFMGVGAIGLSASGTFERSEFGMDHLLQPPLVGDEITLMFEGEFLRSQE